MSEDLIGVPQIAYLLDVSKQRVHVIIRTHADFPKPRTVIGRQRVWSRDAVERWIAAHPDRRRPGPRGPRKAKMGGPSTA